MRRLVWYLILASILASSCRSVSSPETTDEIDPNDAATINDRQLPFDSKEPEKYQATIVFSFRFDESAIDPIEQTTIVARDGLNRRLDFEIDDKRRVVHLETSDGKRLLLLPQRKIYAEIAQSASIDSMAMMPEDYSLAHLLHAKPPDARFRKIGVEIIAGKQLIKYSVDFGNLRQSPNAETETVVWFDAELGLPVKTEITALVDKKPSGAKSLVELRDFKTEPDAGTFIVPADFRQVSPKEIQDLIKPK